MWPKTNSAVEASNSVTYYLTHIQKCFTRQTIGIQWCLRIRQNDTKHNDIQKDYCD
jgi:hypothetical protein